MCARSSGVAVALKRKVRHHGSEPAGEDANLPLQGAHVGAFCAVSASVIPETRRSRNPGSACRQPAAAALRDAAGQKDPT